VRTPITINGRRAAHSAPSPQLGEHTDAILAEIGEG
jgi:crotonobetainyl-CoA:carnitine CoA-transferase CaiB-like acyl-CoA transferase